MSAVVKRSVSIRGHRTSFSVEEEFFNALHVLAEQRGLSLAGLIGEIDATRDRNSNLSSAIRVFVLKAAQDSSAKNGAGNTE